MRDKIVINGKYVFKTAKRPPVQKQKWETIEKIQLEREVQNLKEQMMLRWPYLWQPSLDRFGFWIYCFAHTPLPPDRRDLKEHNFFIEIIIRHFLENKRKYTCRVALVASRVFSFPPLEHVYFWICGAPRCCLHSGWWRSETHSPARCRSCWTIAR